MKKPDLQTSIVVAVVLLLVGVVYFYGPALGIAPEQHMAFVAFVGSVGTMIAAQARQWFFADSDGDGIIDVLDDDVSDDSDEGDLNA